MIISDDMMLKALGEYKILPYEKELVQRLRNIEFQGIPLAISVLSKDVFRGECYVISVNLTKGMDHFKLIHGDVNFLERNDEYPNHSWVEKDGYVYDPTDGFKWDKDLYYSLFHPIVREVYDEKSVKDYPYYQDVLRNHHIQIPLMNQAFIIQYLELLEMEHPSVNHHLLLEEIEIWRRDHHVVKKFSDDIMFQYKKSMEDNKK